jgi:tRNA(Ile)-lysidine synthase
VKIPKLINLPQQILVGFSGGADSTALLLLLHEHYPSLIRAIHFNHGIRPESDDEESWCREFCGSRGIEFESFKFHLDEDVSEDVARSQRILCWQKLISSSDTIVALAHHQDDVNENFFLRLMRGAGLSGLTGLREWKEVCGVRFWRPLLRAHKQDLLNILQQRQVETWCEDKSNATNVYRRNQVRNELLPLYQTIAQQLTGLETSLRVMQGEAEFLEKMAFDFSEKVRNASSLFVWKQVPKVLLARVLRFLVSHQSSVDFIPSFATVERLYEAIHSAKDYELVVPLSQRFYLLVHPSLVTLIDQNQVNMVSIENKDWNPLKEKEIFFGSYCLFKSDDGVRFTVDRLQFPLKISTFQPGDRMQVESGMTKKLKKLFNAEKISPSLRRIIPVVWSGDEIIWVPGVARSRQSISKSGDTQVICLGFRVE